MRKITIGRGRECDVRIDDQTDSVSRRHAVITVSPVGKMKIYDTSSNGTYVNGEKVEKPEGKPVKRGDTVNFARMVDLDWDTVKNPYKNLWIGSGSFLIIVAAIAVIFWIFGEDLMNKAAERNVETTNVVATDSISPVNDSLKLETPKVKTAPVYSPAEPKKEASPAPQKPKAKESKESPVKEMPQTQKDNTPAPKAEPSVTPEKNSSELDELMKQDK